MKKTVLITVLALTIALTGCKPTQTTPITEFDTTKESQTLSLSAGKETTVKEVTEQEVETTVTSEPTPSATATVVTEKTEVEPCITPKVTQPPAVINKVEDDSKPSVTVEITVAETQKPTPTPISTPTPTPVPTPTPIPIVTPEPTPAPIAEIFDIAKYTDFAQSYAVQIGLQLDSSAVDCWDNPITAKAGYTNIEENIRSRLDRYKNIDEFAAVCIWTVKISDSEYEIFIGYA